MGDRVYTGSMDNTALGTAVEDIFSLKSPAGKGAELHHMQLSAAAVTTAAEIRLRFKRGVGTLGGSTGGSAPTPQPTDPGDTQAAACTFHFGDTTQATATTFTVLLYFQWNVLLPFDYMPGPETSDREKIDVSSILVLDLPATIVAVTASGFMKWREYP